MKSRIIIKIVTFLIIFTIGFSALTRFTIAIDDINYQHIAGFYSEPEDSLDAVYIGSSNCFAYWNPAFAWDKFGICVYPYACNSQLFFTTEYLIKETIKKQPDALFIVNINSLNDGEVDTQQMHNILDCMPLSVNKLQLTKHLSDIGGYSISERMEFYFPLIRYHSRWNNSITSGVYRYENNGLKGSSVYEPYLEYIEDITPKYVLSNEKSKLSDDILNSTDSLLDYCDENNINVLFVTVPQAKPIEDIKRYNALNELIQSRGYKTLDLMDSTTELKIDATKDFYNDRHTNIHGSIKYTYYLSEYLIKNYKFTDKRNNPDYNDWNKAYEKYVDYITPHALPVEFNLEQRDFNLKEPGNLKLTMLSSQIKLNWDSVDGAQGYDIYKKTDNGPWTKILSTDKTDFIEPIDSMCNNTYTVVPFYTKNNLYYYGDFSYEGISTQQ